jgi:hypothetical protein
VWARRQAERPRASRLPAWSENPCHLGEAATRFASTSSRQRHACRSVRVSRIGCRAEVALTIDLAAITSGTMIVGLHANPVTVIDARPQGPDAVALVCRDSDGQLGEQLLYRSGLDGLSLQEPGSRCSFDADAHEFQLAAAAMRIRLAGLHDPMLAVSSSEISFSFSVAPSPKGASSQDRHHASRKHRS